LKVESEELLEQFVVGFVRSPHGLSGEFKVESASGYFDHFLDMTEVTLRNGKTGDSRLFKIEEVDAGDHDLYMKLVGMNSPEEAKKFSGWEIVVPRDKACPLGENEWYVEDLKKCSLVYIPKDEDGLEKEPVVIGKITDVMEGGSSDLLEISLAENCDLLTDAMRFGTDEDGRILYKRGENKKPRTVYVPLKEEAGFIGKVDIENRMVQLMHLWILE
jgi:16S rRNA processing protein RimM